MTASVDSRPALAADDLATPLPQSEPFRAHAVGPGAMRADSFSCCANTGEMMEGVTQSLSVPTVLALRRGVQSRPGALVHILHIESGPVGASPLLAEHLASPRRAALRFGRRSLSSLGGASGISVTKFAGTHQLSKATVKSCVLIRRPPPLISAQGWRSGALPEVSRVDARGGLR